jgi:hypothetical protein
MKTQILRPARLPAAAEVRHDDRMIGIGYLIERTVAADADAAQVL